MTDDSVEKDHGLIDRLRETSGIYKLGFERESFIGISLPFIIAFAIAAPLGLLIWLWL